MDLAGYEPTLNEVAGLFGKSSRWIAELRAKGVLPADGASLGEFVEAWISYNTSEDDSCSLEAARTRLATEQAEAQSMKNALSRGELLARSEVTAAVQAAFARVRAKLLSLPSRAAPLVPTFKSATAVQAKLTELVHEALAELAATIVVANDGGEPSDGDDGSRLVAGDDAAADVNGKPVGGREPAAKPRGKRRAG